MAEVDQSEKVCVLLVDDEVNILNSLKRLLLHDKQLKIVTATSGEEGLKQLDELTNVGLIVTDQRMPGMNGAVFLEKAIDKAPDATRIIMTGYADTSAAIDAINKGKAWRYLSKPWDDTELLNSVREGVDRYKIIQENKLLNALVHKQKEELEEWNNNLKSRVLQQTTAFRKKSEELQAALERVRESDSSVQGFIQSLCTLVDLRGTRAYKHAHNVAQLAESAAKEMGLDETTTETIRVAALLHDIGEIGISERLLMTAPEVMKFDEFREYSQHPVRAQLLLDTIDELRSVSELIRHHHENMDGTGYPDKLSGEDIPLGSRIIAFADQIDKTAMMCVGDIAEQALTRVSGMVGNGLDPALHKVFKKVVRYCYHMTPVAEGPKTVEKKLGPDGLRPGMVLARNLYNSAGRAVFSRGMLLDPVIIASVRGHFGLDPSDSSIYVLVEDTK